MFFFIAGIRPRVRLIGGSRVGPCRQCGGDQVFEMVRVQSYVEIFFVPLLALGSGERAWRCTSCQTLRADAGVAGARSDEVDLPGGAARRLPSPTLEAPAGSGVEASRDWGGAGTIRGISLGTSVSVVPRYCYHCGARIEEPPSEGRASGFRRYHCGSCGRDFEVGG